MAIDVAQFHQVFFEESFEGLEVMESGLVDLEVGSPDIEAINAIFRAAHSIKGGSGTFGFSAISDFTHVLETLLDEMRAGKREVTRDAVDVLLLAVDSLRSMLDAARSGTDFDAQAVADVHHKLEEQLHHGAAPNTQAPPRSAAARRGRRRRAGAVAHRVRARTAPVRDRQRPGTHPARARTARHLQRRSRPVAHARVRHLRSPRPATRPGASRSTAASRKRPSVKCSNGSRTTPRSP
jgi:chemotaxis protein histidine kinase CheA